MMGMEMMLKNMLGIDPEEIKEMVERAKVDGAQILTNVFNRLEVIDQKQNLILENQQALYIALRDAGVIKPIDSVKEIHNDGNKH